MNPLTPAEARDEYAYSTIDEYEKLVGHKVNEAFRTGWLMARTMNSHIDALAHESTTDPNRSKE